MILFELKDDKITVSTEVLSVPEFYALWQKDKTKSKEHAYKEFMYIYHTSDNRSPYADFPEGKKQSAIKEDYLKDIGYIPSKDVEEAIKKYKELSVTPMERLLVSVKDKIDEMATFMNNTPITEDSVASILKVIDSVSKVTAQYQNLEDTVKKEREKKKTHVRGDKANSMFED